MQDSPLNPNGTPPPLPNSVPEPRESQAPLEELSPPQLSSKKRLQLALSLLKAGECLEVWTTKSRGYAPLRAEDQHARFNHEPSEPIGEFCWHFGITHVMPYGHLREKLQGFFGDDVHLQLPKPHDIRPPRSALPIAPLSSVPDPHLRGSEMLAQVVDPGFDEVKRSLSSLPLLTEGAVGMPGMFRACRVYQDARQRDDSGGSAECPSFWAPFRPDLAASMRFVPPHVTPLLAGSHDPHRAIELHALHHCFSFFLFSQPEPVSETSLTERSIQLLHGNEFIPSGLWRKRDPSLIFHPGWSLSQDQADFYNREVFLKSETLGFLHRAFIELAEGVARSVPVYGLIKEFDRGGFNPSPLSASFCRGIVKPFKWLLDDYRRTTDFSRQRVTIDIEKGKFRKSLAGVKDPTERAEILLDQVTGYAKEVWPPPGLQLRYLRDPYHPINTYRPPVYNRTEFCQIVDASKHLLDIFLSPDLDAQGPRKGSKAYKHMLEVGMLLMCSGEPPEIVVSGLLHDIYELYEVNQPQRLESVARDIRNRFGIEVDGLIEAVTEPAKKPKDFFPRKTAIINKLESLEFPLAAQVARILCASKLSTLQDGIRYLYEKGTTQGWSEGSWAQNFALYSFYLSVFEKYQVSDSLLVNYRSQLVNFAGWAQTFNSSRDIAELRDNLDEYLASLTRATT